MKYRILYLIALFAMFSCSEQLDSKFPVDNGLETTISVVIPQLPDAHPQSRAMGLNPQLENLKLAVFDNNGYLLEYVSATLTNEQKATENEKEYGYTVTLRPTDFRTYIHFIGNAPENIQYGTETESIGSLFTEGGKEAYWQRIELPDGIQKDGENFVESVVDSLSNVRLVRNFAWIMLELGSEVTNFSMDSYCVVNTYNKGSIAPYNTSSGEFADFANKQTHEDLLKKGYIGFIPAEAELNTAIPAEESWFKTEDKEADKYAYFIYEREKALSNPPFILVKGTYTPESGTPIPNCYYKVDLRESDGDYFPLIRNFRYKVRITKVMHEGHKTAAAAAAGSGSGDVSTAIETEDYTNISNGVARIFVSYTDTTLVAPTDDLKLRYKFMVFKTTDANGTEITPEDIYNDPDHVTIKKGEGNLINSLDRTIVEGADGWGEIAIKTIDATAWDGKPKTQDLIIKGQVTIGTGENAKKYELQRKVTITLTPEYKMKLECDPTEIDKKQGKPFDVIIWVPADLRPDMFPLDIQLEADNQSMTPDKGDDLPVLTGKSIIFTKANKTTIGFIKQIHWDDYAELIKSPVNGFVSFTCHFKRNKQVEAGVNTLIYADNKYFNQAFTTLGSYTSYTFRGSFTNSSINPGEEVTFDFSVSDRPEQGEIYVTLEGLEPAEGEEDILKWDENLGCYKYAVSNLSNKSGSFELTPDGTSNPAYVKLSAYHFEDYKASINVLQFNKFTNLYFNHDNLIAGSEDNVTFTFKMSVVPSYDVFVTLTNLVPADNNTLELVDANIGKYKFKTRPTDTSVSITLKNTATEAGTGTVKLSSLYFNHAEESINVQLNSFSDLKFNPASLTQGVQQNVTFTFNMSKAPTNDVYVTLNNLEPVDNKTLELVDVNTGKYKFKTRPTGTSASVVLRNTKTQAGTVGTVMLSSDYFTTTETTISVGEIVIPKGNLNVGSSDDLGSRDRTFNLYTSDPRTNNIAPFASFTGGKRASNPDAIKIENDDYQDIMGNGGFVYVGYSRSSRDYVAKVSLNELMNREVTIDNWDNY